MILAIKAVIVAFVLLVVHFAYQTASLVGLTGPSGETTVVVEVLNGCGQKGIGERASELLSDQGFDVMFVGNADDFKYDRTLIVDRTGDLSKANAIADVLGVGLVISQLSTASYVEATLVVGNDAAGVLYRRAR